MWYIDEKLGQGCTRQVFVHPMDPSKVVKVPRNEGGDIDNEDELSVWNQATDELRENLAPVHAVTEEGYLIMDRVVMCGKLSLMAAQQIERNAEILVLPQELTWDVHPANYGVLRGRVVMSDYARNRGTDSLSQDNMEQIDSPATTVNYRISELYDKYQLPRAA